jgi:hypothetical protein
VLNVTISTLGLFLDNAVQNGNTQLKGGEGPGKDKPHTITILAQSMGLSADNAGQASASYVGLAKNGHLLDGMELNELGEKQQWLMQPELTGGMLKVYTEAGAKSVTWTPAVEAAAAGANVHSAGSGGERAPREQELGPVWLKTTFDAPTGWDPNGKFPLAMDLGAATKGHLYVNGFDCGKYWIRDGTAKQAQRYYQIPQDVIKQRGNLLVLFEEIAVFQYNGLRVVAPDTVPISA